MTMEYNHILWAREMKNKYPALLKSFKLLEIVEIWEAYSLSEATGWITEDEDKVKEVFSNLI